LKKKFILFIGLPLLICSFLSCASDARTRNIVSKFKQTEVGRGFLLNHSEKDLEKVLAFLQDPVRNFRSVQRVADVCSHEYAYANYLAETKQKDDAGYMTFFSTHFQVATDDNVPILTYLILNCNNAFLGEAYADRYTVLFKSSPEIFIKDLRRRKNWKQIVDEIRAGNGRAFREGLAKLGDSGFELELKNYVLSMSK
jgi:hypothetical protein